MPTFRTLAPLEPPPPPGFYIGKVAKAGERVSEAGNPMLVMRIELADGRTLPSILTFVEAARPVLNAFCASAGLLIPSESDVEVDLRAEHVRGRYLYFRVEADEEGDSRITRFLDRQSALAANPHLADIKLSPQQPFALPIVRSLPL